MSDTQTNATSAANALKRVTLKANDVWLGTFLVAVHAALMFRGLNLLGSDPDDEELFEKLFENATSIADNAVIYAARLDFIVEGGPYSSEGVER